MILCLVVMVVGISCEAIGLMDNIGRELVIGSSAMLFGAMRGNGKPSVPGTAELNVSSTTTVPAIPEVGKVA